MQKGKRKSEVQKPALLDDIRGRAAAGDVARFSMTAGALIISVHRAIDCINGNIAGALTDITRLNREIAETPNLARS